MKKRDVWRLLFALGLCALALSLVYAQDDLQQQYQSSYQFSAQLLNTLIFSCTYLFIYASALVITLYFLQLFPGFDFSMFAWIAILWLGGMGANYLAYTLAPSKHLPPALIALPLIFGWSMLICTRSFADLALSHAAIVSLVIALVCTPYFGPTWQIKPAPGNPNSSSAVENRCIVHLSMGASSANQRCLTHRSGRYFSAIRRPESSARKSIA